MDKKTPKSVTFIYQKTPNYHAYNVDGVFGGLSPKDKIFIEFFSEKFATPTVEKHDLLENGTLGKITEKEQEKGIIREIEMGVYLDIPTAISLANWLNQRIEQFKELKGKEAN